MDLRSLIGALGLLLTLVGGFAFFALSANDGWYRGAETAMAVTFTTTVLGLALAGLAARRRRPSG